MPLTDGGISFAVMLVQRGFVVEEVDVREAFGLEEAEDALGLGGEVGQRRRGPRAAVGDCVPRRCARSGEEERAEARCCRCRAVASPRNVRAREVPAGGRRRDGSWMKVRSRAFSSG